MNGNKNIIEIDKVSFSYDKKDVLENVTLQIPNGAFLGLVGPNGSGKSTLTKIILGLLKPRTGNVKLFGTPIEQFKDWSRIGYVSQKASSFNTGFPATVLEVVMSGLTSKVGLFHFLTKEHKRKALDAIDSVGMTEFRNRNIGELSGGQQQRVFIARALVSDPDLLILDEPTVGVDVKNVETFYGMLATLNKNKNITLFMITHDIGTITEHATQVACLNKTLHFHGDPNQFTHLDDQELSSFYGHQVHVITHDHSHGGHV